MSYPHSVQEVAVVRGGLDALPAETTAVRLLWLLRAHVPHGLLVEPERIRLRIAVPADDGPAQARHAIWDALAHHAFVGWRVEL
ncbi:hypothetical protein [Streptomyces sp. NBRC 109706]|uniref:hypothetical protein n=1 Tax=Streptomyces sp. NBRC 109706 TaxID=1550035 RepID=UPI000785F9BE|nr:hypothetical protein [Streptomyces sp. NBRC 109706]